MLCNPIVQIHGLPCPSFSRGHASHSALDSEAMRNLRETTGFLDMGYVAATRCPTPPRRESFRHSLPRVSRCRDKPWLQSLDHRFVVDEDGCLSVSRDRSRLQLGVNLAYVWVGRSLCVFGFARVSDIHDDLLFRKYGLAWLSPVCASWSILRRKQSKRSAQAVSCLAFGHMILLLLSRRL